MAFDTSNNAGLGMTTSFWGNSTIEIVFFAEDEGFEPSIGFPIHAFQACALGRYANPPELAPQKVAYEARGELYRCYKL